MVKIAIYNSGDYKELAEKFINVHDMSLNAREAMGRCSHDLAFRDYTYEIHLKALKTILSI